MSITKDQWLRATGGFRVGENHGQFLNRMAEIRKLRELIKNGKATSSDVYRLSKLLGGHDHKNGTLKRATRSFKDWGF